MERLEDNESADRRQSILGAAQRALQGRQGPSSGPVLLAVRRAPELLENAFLFRNAIPHGISSAVPAGHRLHPFPVETAHEFGHAPRGKASAYRGSRESSAV